jgi:hypothetical protein
MTTDYRKELLLRLYKELWDSIHSLMASVWQSIGAIIGSLAIFALVEKKIVNLDIATSIVVAICTWSLASIIDASFWYNRNLAMVANIEREFLIKSDLVDIHFYFEKHRKDNEMISQFVIQFSFVIVILLIFLIFHFVDRVVPGFCSPIKTFEFFRALPYILTTIASIILYKFWNNRKTKYNEFEIKSPGRKHISDKMST